MRPSTRPVLPPILVALTVLGSPAGPAAATKTSPLPGFSLGVASGDVTPFSAVLWTRVEQEATLMLEVSTDPHFGVDTLRRLAFASPAKDFTVKELVAPLRPAQVYFYRWRSGTSASDVGTFRTAPLPFVSSDVRFTYTGDSDGLFSVFGNTFATLDAARSENADFFVYLGDTIYADSALRPLVLGLGPAATLDEFRAAYKANRGFDALRALLQATSTYAIWDDHEVQDDFAGQTVDPTIFANGREAFLEYMPLRPVGFLNDPTCAARPLFRTFKWGKDVDIFILDERSCRSAKAESACLVAPGLPDLAPTLPPPVRAAFGGLLQPSPPAGCLQAIFDPSRTMLGGVQKALLKGLLQHSTAKFKFIINEVPIQQFYALPYDRWEGYGFERAEILNFIRANQIRNVVFLTTDTHANLVNEVFVDRFLDPVPIATELVTGPIATFTFQQEIELFASGIGLPPAVALDAFNQILTLVGTECRDLNRDSYGLVEVSSSSGIATITLKDDAGHLVTDALTGVPCIKTIGP